MDDQSAERDAGAVLFMSSKTLERKVQARAWKGELKKIHHEQAAGREMVSVWERFGEETNFPVCDVKPGARPVPA